MEMMTSVMITHLCISSTPSCKFTQTHMWLHWYKSFPLHQHFPNAISQMTFIFHVLCYPIYNLVFYFVSLTPDVTSLLMLSSLHFGNCYEYIQPRNLWFRWMIFCFPSFFAYFTSTQMEIHIFVSVTQSMLHTHAQWNDCGHFSQFSIV